MNLTNTNYEVYPLKFSELLEKYKPSKIDRENKVFSVLKLYFSQVLALNGIIAGGFVEKLISNNISNKCEITNDLLYYLKYSDIDIFSESKENFECAHAAFNYSLLTRNGSVNSVDSICKFAKNVTIDCKISDTSKVTDVTKFQFVNCIYGNVEEILNSFDLINCKAAVVDDDIIIHKDLLNCLKQRQIELENCNSYFFLGRILKYILKFKIESTTITEVFLSEKTIDLISKNFAQVYCNLKDHPITGSHGKNTFNVLDQRKFRCQLSSILEDQSIDFDTRKKLFENIINSFHNDYGHFEKAYVKLSKYFDMFGVMKSTEVSKFLVDKKKVRSYAYNGY